jgi:hypothetical protein
MESLNGGNGHGHPLPPDDLPRSLSASPPLRGPLPRTRERGSPGDTATGAPVGEVIDTSVADFVAQACTFDVAPPFGGFVKVTVPERTIYGIVYAIHSGSIEPGGRPVLRGRDGMRDRAIYDQNPDLEQLLRTEFSALIVGYEERGALRRYLPPSPPSLHWSVVACDVSEVVRLTERLDYLRTILAAPDVPADALLAANIRLAREARPTDPGFTIQAGRELATLLKHDYPRLTSILRSLVG